MKKIKTSNLEFSDVIESQQKSLSQLDQKPETIIRVIY